MRRALRTFPALLALALLLSSCVARTPVDREALGWAEDWTALGDVAAAEPVEGFTPTDILDKMASTGLWYAAWSYGDGTELTGDAEGDPEYLAQIYLLIQYCGSSEGAEMELEQWRATEREHYGCTQPVDEEYAGRVFSVMELTAGGEKDLFDAGICAFTTVGGYALSVEVMALQEAPITLRGTLETFINGLHLNLGEDGGASGN